MKSSFFLWSILVVPFISHSEIISDVNIIGKTVMHGYVVSAPCSIETDSQYQYINYDFPSQREIEQNKTKKIPLNIKLNNCLSEYDNDSRKGIKIKFFSNNDIYNNAVKLSGPTDGVIIYIYDTNNNLVTPNKSYSVSNSTIYFDSKKKNSFLKYETRIEIINKNIEPGNYFTTIKFNISYD